MRAVVYGLALYVGTFRLGPSTVNILVNGAERGVAARQRKITVKGDCIMKYKSCTVEHTVVKILFKKVFFYVLHFHRALPGINLIFFSRRFCFEFHLASLEVAVPHIIRTVTIITIQIRTATVVIPPSSSVAYSDNKEVAGLRDSHSRVIASYSLARTSISFKDLPPSVRNNGGIFEYSSEQWLLLY